MDKTADQQIEEAISFLVFAIKKSGNNPKPVILHSIKIGFHLYNLWYNKDIVIAAILHDVIEDSETTPQEIETIFGIKIVELVIANSFDSSIKDKTTRYQECFSRCAELGIDALIIKAADILDNADYYFNAENDILINWLLEKMKYFIDYSRDYLQDEYLYVQLVEKYQELITTQKN